MTCPCHDPAVFGHLRCPRPETQPRARHVNQVTPWQAEQALLFTQAFQTLTHALRAAPNPPEAPQATQNR